MFEGEIIMWIVRAVYYVFYFPHMGFHDQAWDRSLSGSMRVFGSSSVYISRTCVLRVPTVTRS